MEKDEGMASGDDIVRGGEDASEGGNDAESGKVGAGNQFDGDTLGLLAEGKAGGVAEAAKNVGDGCVGLAKITENGMGDRVAAPVAAVVASAHGEQDELLRILDGEEPQQDLVEKGENGGVRADAESQGQYGNGREAGDAHEHAEWVLQVPKDGNEPAEQGPAPGPIFTRLSPQKPPPHYIQQPT